MAKKISLYHVNTSKNANSILKHGFRDGEGTYGTDRNWKGVFLSDRILDANEGACGDTVLEVILDCHNEILDFFEWRKMESLIESGRFPLIY
jgi:hypothetical protein